MGAARAQAAATTMPQSIPEVQAALSDLLVDPVKAIYVNTPALMDAVQKHGLTPQQVIEQGILYVAKIQDPELRGIYTIVLMPHLQRAFQVSTSAAIEATLPFLEMPAKSPEFEIAHSTLGLTGAMQLSAAFGLPAEFPEIASYLSEQHRQHPERLPPFALISSMYSIHPGAALHTMWAMYKLDDQTADQIRRWTHEVDGMIADLLAWRDTPEQRNRLLEIISQAAKSPHWHIRLYAAALARRPELQRVEIPDPFPKGDEHEIVARFLKEFPLKK